jgi:hypothetical protein
MGRSPSRHQARALNRRDPIGCHRTGSRSSTPSLRDHLAPRTGKRASSLDRTTITDVALDASGANGRACVKSWISTGAKGVPEASRHSLKARFPGSPVRSAFGTT